MALFISANAAPEALQSSDTDLAAAAHINIDKTCLNYHLS